jgi:hypothetical protein
MPSSAGLALRVLFCLVMSYGAASLAAPGSATSATGGEATCLGFDEDIDSLVHYIDNGSNTAALELLEELEEQPQPKKTWKARWCVHTLAALIRREAYNCAYTPPKSKEGCRAASRDLTISAKLRVMLINNKGARVEYSTAFLGTKNIQPKFIKEAQRAFKRAQDDDVYKKNLEKLYATVTQDPPRLLPTEEPGPKVVLPEGPSQATWVYIIEPLAASTLKGRESVEKLEFRGVSNMDGTVQVSVDGKEVGTTQARNREWRLSPSGANRDLLLDLMSSDGEYLIEASITPRDGLSSALDVNIVSLQGMGPARSRGADRALQGLLGLRPALGYFGGAASYRPSFGLALGLSGKPFQSLPLRLEGALLVGWPNWQSPRADLRVRLENRYLSIYGLVGVGADFRSLRSFSFLTLFRRIGGGAGLRTDQYMPFDNQSLLSLELSSEEGARGYGSPLIFTLAYEVRL